MYSTMYLCFISFFFFHDNEVGGGMPLSWPKFSLFFLDARLILLRHNTYARERYLLYIQC